MKRSGIKMGNCKKIKMIFLLNTQFAFLKSFIERNSNKSYN